ncbi:RBP45A, partial [Symbiodinium microadriaticum]
GSVAASEVSKAEEIRPRKRESTKARRLSEKQDAPPAAAANAREEDEPKSHSSPQSFEVPIPDVPWAETPDQAPIKAFNFDKAVEGPLSPVQEEVPRATTRETGEKGPPETSQEPPEEMAPAPSPAQAPASAAPEPHTDPAAKVFQFDFSVFDFLKHEALQTPPDSPVPGLLPEVADVKRQSPHVQV